MPKITLFRKSTFQKVDTDSENRVEKDITTLHIHMFGIEVINKVTTLNITMDEDILLRNYGDIVIVILGVFTIKNKLRYNNNHKSKDKPQSGIKGFSK